LCASHSRPAAGGKGEVPTNGRISGGQRQTSGWLNTFVKKKAHSKQISGKPGGQYAKDILYITDVACIFQVSVYK